MDLFHLRVVLADKKKRIGLLWSANRHVLGKQRAKYQNLGITMERTKRWDVRQKCDMVCFYNGSVNLTAMMSTLLFHAEVDGLYSLVLNVKIWQWLKEFPVLFLNCEIYIKHI